MNEELTLELLRRHRVIAPGGDPMLSALYEGAIQQANLNLVDYLTLRDLVEVTGYTDVEVPMLLLCLFSALNEGSTCLPLTSASLAGRLTDFLRDRVEALQPEVLSKAIIEKVEAGRYADLISDDSQRLRPLVLRKAKDGSNLYFQKYDLYERTLGLGLGRLLTREESAPGIELEAIRKIVREVLEESPLRRNGSVLSLGERQRLALGLALLKDFVLISGGPGTGKTSIVLTLLRCLVRLGIPAERIRLAAPTGRSAQRLTELIGAGLESIEAPGDADERLRQVPCLTIHRLLRYSPHRNAFLQNAGNPIPADVIVVDEVSMVDVALMARLLEAVPLSAKVVLLGDKDQLPSVEAGAVLADLIPKTGVSQFSEEACKALEAIVGVRVQPTERKAPLIDRTAVLLGSYRSEKSILDVAEAVNRGDVSVAKSLEESILEVGIRPAAAKSPGKARSQIRWPEPEDTGGVLRCPGGGWRWIPAEPENRQRWRSIVESWAERLYLQPRNAHAQSYRDLVRPPFPFSALDAPENRERLEWLFAMVNEARVLTVVRAGLFGAEGINRTIERRLRPELDPGCTAREFAGALVMIARNDYSRQLFNGDVGVVLRGLDSRCRAVFARRGAFVSFALESLPPHEPAFAMTVHKSQGSEFGRVLLVLPPDAGHRLLTREILYTGLTRAKYLAVLYGTREAFRRAIERRIERHSGLDLEMVGED